MAFAWNQPNSIYIQPGILTEILLTYTVSQDAVPDSLGIFLLHANSQNDSSRSDTLEVTVTASMVSDASVFLQDSQVDTTWAVNPGEFVSITFEIINNASVQDIFSTSAEIIGFNDWAVVDIVPEQMFLNSKSSGTFVVTLQSPESAQYGDNCPSIIAEINSQRSGQNYQSKTYENLAIRQVNDVSILEVNSPDEIIPGQINNFNLTIENLGNGPVTSTVTVDNIPSSWDWWIQDENEQILTTIQLSERSEFAYLQDLNLMIDVPAGVEPKIVERLNSVVISTLENSKKLS